MGVHPLHPGAVDVLRLEVAGFLQPQPAPVDRHEKGAGFEPWAAGGQQSFDLLDTKHLRTPYPPAAVRQRRAQEVHRALQHRLVKQTQTADDLIDRAGGELSLPRQVIEIALELLIRQLVRPLVVVLGQPGDRLDVGVHGPR